VYFDRIEEGLGTEIECTIDSAIEYPRPIPSEGKCCVCYIQRMKLTKENILKIALGLLIGISIGYLIAEYLLPIVRQ